MSDGDSGGGVGQQLLHFTTGGQQLSHFGGVGGVGTPGIILPIYSNLDFI